MGGIARREKQISNQYARISVMVYQRKTRDEWHIYVNYGLGDGWELETVELTRQEAKRQIKCYRENCPYPVKLVKRRVAIETKN